MKIIRSRGTSAGRKREVPPARETRTGTADARLRKKDAETLDRMLESIREFRAGEKNLATLVNELEYHLQSVSRGDEGWRHAFFGHWRDLDRELKKHVQGGDQAIEGSAMRRIELALGAVEHLTEGKLGRMAGA